MAVTYPGAVFKSLGTQTEPSLNNYDIICLHTMVGSLVSTYNYFKQEGYTGPESHFGVGGIWGADAAPGNDGVVWQFQDLDYQADANLDGNWHVISIETADNAPSQEADILEWTPKQCESIAQLIAWLCKKYNIPATLIPDTKPGRRGIGYHRQGCEHSDGLGSHPGWLVSGGERWSSAIGKGCPATRRIAQVTSTIIPRVQAILSGTPTPEEVMSNIPFVGVASGQTQAYLVSAAGKRRVPGTPERDYLVGTLEVPYLTNVPSSIMNLFPTLTLDSNNVAVDAAIACQAQLTAVAGQLTAIAAQLGDDPTAAQVTALSQQVSALAVAESDNATAAALAEVQTSVEGLYP
jgi:hypothetical protein